jgi:hypothetical protein
VLLLNLRALDKIASFVFYFSGILQSDFPRPIMPDLMNVATCFAQHRTFRAHLD